MRRLTDREPTPLRDAHRSRADRRGEGGTGTPPSPDLELTDTATRIIPATGRTTPRTVFDYRCAQELATLLGTEITELLGGHNGNTTHPRAYAVQLRRILQGT